MAYFISEFISTERVYRVYKEWLAQLNEIGWWGRGGSISQLSTLNVFANRRGHTHYNNTATIFRNTSVKIISRSRGVDIWVLFH